VQETEKLCETRGGGRAVAIKLAAGLEDMDSVRQRFDREAAVLSVISSAHVVELIWAGPTTRAYRSSTP
jgi:hypothetical protein